MDYRILGKTGLKVSSMGFGGIPIQRIDAAGTRKLMERMVEAGAKQAAQETHQGTQQAPLQESHQVFLRMMQFLKKLHSLVLLTAGLPIRPGILPGKPP